MSQNKSCPLGFLLYHILHSISHSLDKGTSAAFCNSSLRGAHLCQQTISCKTKRESRKILCLYLKSCQTHALQHKKTLLQHVFSKTIRFPSASLPVSPSSVFPLYCKPNSSSQCSCSLSAIVSNKRSEVNPDFTHPSYDKLPAHHHPHPKDLMCGSAS